MTITDLIGSNWYRGQVSFGTELLAFGTSEPLTGYGVGITPCNTPLSASIDYGPTSKVAEVRYGQISVVMYRNSQGSSTLPSWAEPELHGY